MSRWFRLYDEVLDDPKVQKLSPELFKFWINLLCLASKKDGLLPDVEAVSFALRTPFHETQECLKILFQANLLDQSKKGFSPHAWSKRQYKSDTSTERVKRFRQRYRNVTSTVTETPPDTYTETDTDTEQKQIQIREKNTRGTRLAKDWSPSFQEEQFARQEGVDFETEVERFRDYWIAQAGQRGVKADWSATWRNWCRKATKTPTAKPIPMHDGEVMINEAFPPSGTIRYSRYADFVRSLGTGLDPDWIADRFRPWAESKGIALDGPDVIRAFRGFARAQKKAG